MPLAGFRCPPWVATAGQTNDIDFCLTECPNPCVAPPLLAAMWQSEHSNHHVGAYISASMLAGSSCARQTVLERNHPFYEIPLRRFWPFRGTHAHSIVERAADVIAPLGWVQELRMAAEFVYDDYASPIFNRKTGLFTGRYNEHKPLIITVGGTCDCYNPWRKELWDMKSCKDVKAEYMITGKKPAWFKDNSTTFSPHLEDSWVKQVNIYRLLLSKTKVPAKLKEQLQLTGEYFPAPEYLGIQAISMAEIPRSGAPYAYRKAIHEVDAVPVWPLEEIETFVRREALQWFKWLVLGEPTPVVPQDKAWLCGSCAFNADRFPEGPCHPTQERDNLNLVE